MGAAEELGWADAAAARRRALFVGREEQLRALERRLEGAHAAHGAPQLVTILGAAGVGKSTVARRFGDVARAAGSAVIWLSGDELPANAGDLARALERQGVAGFDELGRRAAPDLLVLDAFERLSTLDRWLFDRMLPRAGARLMVLVTSRQRLDVRLRGELAMQLEALELELPPLSPDDAARLLALRRVPAALHAHIAAFCRGHALSLALFAERYGDREDDRIDPAVADDVVGTLVRELLRGASSDARRRALFALALTSAVDERLLRALGDPSPEETAAWLCDCSFTSVGPGGATPHALVRDALHAHLCTRATDLLAPLAARIVDELVTRVDEAPLEQRLQLVLQALYARRDVPFIRDHLGLDRLRQVHLRRGTQADAARLARVVESVEGARAAARFAAWTRLQPGSLFVIADHEPTPAGAQLWLDLAGTTAEQRAADPLTERAYRALEGRGQAGAYYARWFFARDGWQAPGPDLTAAMFAGPLISGEIEHTRILFQVPEPERWAPFAQAFSLTRVPGELELDGVRWGLFERDLAPLAASVATRAEYRTALVRQLLSTVAAMSVEPPAGALYEVPPAVAGARLAPALSEAEFDEAVREALPRVHRRHELAESPLSRSALARDAGTPLEAADALVATIREACGELARSPAYREAARILDATFLAPPAKQRAAAAALGLPYGTYRHKLRAAVALLTKELHARELHARGRPPR